MKSRITALVLMMSLAFMPFSTTHGQAHQQGDVDLSPGIGVGNYGYYKNRFVNYGFPIGFYADFGVHDYASVGPYGGIILWGDHIGVAVGGRGIFHFWQLIDDKVSSDLRAEILDFYFSVFLGYEIHDNAYYGDRFWAAGLLGIRWYFVDHIALFGEVGGTPFGYSTIGVTFKIGKRK